MNLTLVIDSTSIIRWWVDASHMTHLDCKGHTGGMMSLRKGAALSYSEKHKLNTKSSTESELVGADAMLIKVLWARYFLEAQGYTVEQNIVFQDNQATMQLEVNGAFLAPSARSTSRLGIFSSRTRSNRERCPPNTARRKHCGLMY